MEKTKTKIKKERDPTFEKPLTRTTPLAIPCDAILLAA